MKEVERLQPVVEAMKHPCCLTFSIAHERFPDQRAIFEWIKKNRYVQRTIAKLFEAGYLVSKRYYCKLEFQMGDHFTKEEREAGKKPTEQCHFHVIVDCKREWMPHDFLMQVWNRGRPKFAKDHPSPDYPMMGFAHYRWVDDGGARYAAKYVGKDTGVPGWFLDYLDEGHNAMFSTTSRGFYPPKDKSKQGTGKPRGHYRSRMPVRNRMAQCGKDACVTEEVMVIGGVRRRFKGKPDLSWREAVHKVVKEPDFELQARRIKISRRQMLELLGEVQELEPHDFYWPDGESADVTPSIKPDRNSISEKDGSHEPEGYG